MEFLQITEFPAPNPKLSAPFSPSKRHEQKTTRGASHSAKSLKGLPMHRAFMIHFLQTP